MKWHRQSQIRKKSKKHEWPVKDMLAAGLRESLDDSLEMLRKSSGRIEPWQFCLSGHIVCLGVMEMIDNVLITLLRS